MSVSSRLRRQALTWALWGMMTLVAGFALARRLTSDTASREIFLPGETTHGHYQIELDCGACHQEPFGTVENFQAACIGCHAEELDAAQDSHPETKFTDPRNAERVAKLDARFCITCHGEHQPERTGSMGLSLPGDYCYQCHQDIGEERASHVGLPFDSCASAGCHNFHDNRALYEDLLVRRGEQPAVLASPIRSTGTAKSCPDPRRQNPPEAFDVTACQECHEFEARTWMAGRHGMRVARDLPPMKVADARLPMKASADHQSLTCASCHAPGKDSAFATAQACLGCHDDEHSRAYRNSKHFALLQQEKAERIARGSGVSCATCHMPRFEDDAGTVHVQHNQNDNLRPNEKMVRSVCESCHGLAFSLDALADDELIRSNFAGQPSIHVSSVDWALARDGD